MGFWPRIFLIIALLVPGGLRAAEWKLIKYGGRDHVSLENVAQFYGFTGVTRASQDFNVRCGLRSLRGRVGSQEFYINNLKFILSYPVLSAEGRPLISRMDLTKVIEPVLRPSRIQSVERVDTIVIDPGHGGSNNGAHSAYGDEKSFTLDVGLRLRTLLQERGFKVQMTRTTDVFVSLDDRVRFANRFPNALFISVHFNDGRREATGLETYTLAPRGVPSMAADGPRVSDLDPCPGNVRDAENMALATATHAAVVGRTRLFDRGIKRARFVVIRDITIPGVLVEGGFLSNRLDNRLIATPDYRQGLALSLANAVENYRRAVGTTPPPNLVAGKPLQLRELGAPTASQPAQAYEPTVVAPTTN
jgi:N-acetylmuramoyl-L-alanine amidase